MATQKNVLDKPVWLKMTEKELQKVIAELSQKHPPAKIGIILRDQYGVPTTRLYGKKLSEYLKEAGIENKQDLESAERKVDRLKEHLKNNVTDRKAKHKLQKAQSRLNIVKKYFSRKK